jgi:hypothetical protein
MTVQYYVAVQSDGNIVGAGTTDLNMMIPSNAPSFGPPRQYITEKQWVAIGKDFFGWRWDAGTNMPVPREAMLAVASTFSLAADGVATMQITSIPAGTIAKITGAVTVAPFVIDDGHLELSSTKPGVIKVELTRNPTYKPWKVSIYATA